ncbi:MAG: hypothetical protein ACREQM_17545 [Candidatus Dormibacteraceae bacterium]
MKVRRFLVAAAAVVAIGVIGVLGYMILFTQGFGPLQGNQVPWLGHKQPAASTTGQSSDPGGSKGADAGSDGGTQTPELPSDLLLLIGLVPVGASLLVLDRRRARAERR